MEFCPPPNADERATLEHIKAEPNVRLACQLRPSSDISFIPLVRTHRPIYRQTIPSVDADREIGARSPMSLGGTSVHILLYVEDVDTTFNKAVKAGAKVQRPLADQFYGDRTGGIEDPFGHVWYVATHVEDVTPEEMKKRAAAAGY